MSRVSILVFSLLSLASLGAAQSSTTAGRVKCPDGTYCEKDEFCGTDKSSGRTVCAVSRLNMNLCEALCDAKTQVCVQENRGQLSCQPLVICDSACATADHEVCFYDEEASGSEPYEETGPTGEKGACLPSSSPDSTGGAVDCGGEDGFCPTGSFCYKPLNFVETTVCVPYTANDVLCSVPCSSKRETCYVGPQDGQVSCPYNCDTNRPCTANNTFCVKVNSDDAEGLCLKYSQEK